MFAKLLRIPQWYKNLVIFLPLIFIGGLFDSSDFRGIILGFIALCLISSTNYIINDILDKKKDRLNPEKAKRPIAAGKIATLPALFIALMLFLGSTYLAYTLSFYFLISVLILFILTQLYSLFLKHEPFIDILIIPLNFVIRAVSGTFIIYSTISPWLILCTFFLALFLAVGKREAEISYLKDYSHRPILKYYTSQLTNVLMAVSTTSLLFSYALYSFLSQYPLLLVTLPFAIYTIFRYLHLIYSGSEIARHPEKIIKDKRMIIGILLWTISIFLIIY